MSKIIDISWKLNSKSTSWRNEYPLKLEALRTWEENECRTTNITIYNHSGTHVGKK
jgi:kynurenine formamidase